MLAHDRFADIQLDTTTQPILNVAFFTSIGMGASLALLRRGGIQVAIFLAFATAFCFVQNFIAVGIAQAFGENPLLGVMAGSVTRRRADDGDGVRPGIRNGGIGGCRSARACSGERGLRWFEFGPHLRGRRVEVEQEDTPLIRNMVILALAIGLGSFVSRWIQSLGVTLPTPGLHRRHARRVGDPEHR